MLKILRIIIFCFFIFYFTESQAFRINGTVNGNGFCKKIYLWEYMGSEVFLFDSTQIDNGKFIFKFINPIPRGFYRMGSELNSSFDIILGSEDLDITFTCDSTQKSAVIYGSNENKANETFYLYNISFNSNAQEINKEASSIQTKFPPGSNDYNSEMQRFKKKFDSLENTKNNYYKDLSELYTTSFISKISMFYRTPVLSEDSVNRTKYKSQTEYERAFFINPSYYKDEELTRGVMLEQKILIYFQKYYQGNPEVMKEALRIINLTPKNSRSREVVFTYLIKLFKTQNPDFCKELLFRFCEEFPKSKLLKVSTTFVGPLSPTDMGSTPPDIKLKNPEGKEISLYSLRGKIVLLDFWASWCGPCRKENPNVVRAYNKFKDKGFTIFSVSLDNSKEKWLNAIKADNLSWIYHVSDLQAWGSAPAQLYDVHSIPIAFLLNEKGVIIAKNLRGDELELKLNEVINKKKANPKK